MKMNTPERRCCKVDTVCGYSLKRAVFYVGFATFVISSVTFLTSVVYLAQMGIADTNYNTLPVQAINMLMALYCTSISVYQLVLSIMLLWQSVWTKWSAFICSTWYVSHVTIMVFYFLLIFARTIVCMYNKFYASGMFTIIAGVIYNGIFAYFTVIVCNYLRTLDEDNITR